MATTIYGASDDLIEVDGDITEEFDAIEQHPCYLGFSTGVVLRIEYGTDGIWHIRPEAGKDKVHIEFETSDGEGDSYSDRATITEPVEWVVCGHEWGKR